MITSKQILELWKITDISRYGQEVDIYENPTSSDFLEMTKKARDEKRPFAGVNYHLIKGQVASVAQKVT